MFFVYLFYISGLYNHFYSVRPLLDRLVASLLLVFFTVTASRTNMASLLLVFFYRDCITDQSEILYKTEEFYEFTKT